MGSGKSRKAGTMSKKLIERLKENPLPVVKDPKNRSVKYGRAVSLGVWNDLL
jgi:hypothetical protein